jgi:hypothetical protein
LAAEVARRTLEPSPPFLDGQAAALACDLYRQAVYWVLTNDRAHDAAGPASNDLRTLWQGADRALLLAAAGSAESLSALEEALVDRDFVQLSRLSADEQIQLAYQIRAFVEALLGAGAQKSWRIEQLLYQRTLRVLGVLLCVAGAWLAVWFAGEALERSREISNGKEWRASSHGHSACKSPQQRCRSGYFFHTKDQDEPWVTLDLAEEMTFSAVRIDNRADCCRERAVPLIVEVSTDGKTFREVARRTEDFESWTAEFEPVSARFVRARLAAKNYLHLKRFKVLR